MKIADLRWVFPYTSLRDANSGPSALSPAVPVVDGLADNRGRRRQRGHCIAPPEAIRPYLVDRHLRPILIGAGCLPPRKAVARTGRCATFQRRPFDGQDGRHRRTGVVGTFSAARSACRFLARSAPIATRSEPVTRPCSGDENKGGLSTPQEYAAFALTLVKRGYKGIGLTLEPADLMGARSEDRCEALCCRARSRRPRPSR